MKRIFGIILSVFFICAFVSCNLLTSSGQNNQNSQDKNSQNNKPQTNVEDLYWPDECNYTRPSRSELVSVNPTAKSSRKDSLDFIFNNQTLGKTTIVIRRSEWNKLCNDYRYFYKNENCVHAESYIYEKDGMKWDLKDVGFRLRGNTSRYCPQGLDNGREQNQMNKDWNGDYYDTEGVENKRYRQTHFKIDFEEFCGDDEELKMSKCMKGVNLKRMDASCTREIFCYDLFHRYGIWTAPRASHTTLTLKIIEDIEDPEATEPTTSVNYGVYEMFEEVNKQSLKARAGVAANAWEDNKGNLWKCSNDLTMSRIGEMGVEDIRVIRKGETLPADMQTNGREYGSRVGYLWKQYSMDLKTNKDKFASASSEFKSFITELNSLPKAKDENDTSAIATIKAFYEKWFDVDFFLKTYAINILCGMDDDYWGNANNFYLYFGENSDGDRKVYLIPFDYDNTLGCSISEGGFEHDPLDWGRGKNRPLMDKLLMVPEYKERFAELLKEVSAEDSEWNFDDCSKCFLDWKEMVSPYLNSPDLTGRQGTLGWGDYSWQPSGYSLTSKSNNIYDAARMYIRMNLGEEIEGLDGDTAKELIKNPGKMGGASECSVLVEVRDDGLFIKKEHNTVWEHVAIRIYDKTDSKDNVRIDTDEKTNEFLYPFVQKNHLYTVGLTLQTGEAYDWEYKDAREEGVSVLVKAKGGLGNYRITNSGYSYYSPDYSIVFSDYKVIKPDIEYENERIEGTICDDGSWKGNREYPLGLTIKESFTGSIMDLSAYDYFLKGCQRIFVVINQKFTYKNFKYEYTIIENYDNYFVDTNNSSIKYPESDEPKEEPQYETGTASDGQGEKVSISKSKENPPFDEYKGTYSDCTVTVTPRYDGLYITKSHDSIWDHVAIHVRDKTIGKENVRITTDALSDKFLYPFVQKNHEYEVWLTVQSEAKNWHYSDFRDMKITVTALGGKGNYWVSHSDYRYDSPTYSIVFEDLTFARPSLEDVKPHIDAGIYHAVWEGESKWPNNLPLYKSVLDLSKEKGFLKGQPTIFVSITLKFTYNKINYEYTILENNKNLFKDTN